jgi:hypothetical protein
MGSLGWHIVLASLGVAFRAPIVADEWAWHAPR